MDQEKLKEMYKKIKDSNKKGKPNGKKIFCVEVAAEYSDVLYVLAKNEEEAKELAIHNFDERDTSRDISVFSNREIGSINEIEEEWQNSIPFSEDNDCITCLEFFEENDKDLPPEDHPGQLFLDLGPEAEICS